MNSEQGHDHPKRHDEAQVLREGLKKMSEMAERLTLKLAETSLELAATKQRVAELQAWIASVKVETV